MPLLRDHVVNTDSVFDQPRALLDLPRRRWRGRRHRLASLVPARDFWMSAARSAELQSTSHFGFLRGASSCD
jgi:hypothetical protein